MTITVLISRQLDRYTCFTFCILLVLNVQQACSNVVPLEGSGMDLGDPCIKDCSDVPTSQLCGSNGKTYENMCQFENAKCEGRHLRIVYKEPCLTLPPPPENLCKKHQERYSYASPEEYAEKCNITKLRKKVADNTLQLMDIHDICYRPNCISNDYYPIQCSRSLHGWCWCSDTKGIRIEGTLKKGLNEKDCTGRKSCEVNGRVYSDGLFVPESGCGLCECLDGEVTCFEDYIPSITKELNATQLEQLKDELLQLFFFQYNHKEHVLIDIRHIHQHPTLISDSMKKTVLLWKFEYYDRNGNKGLSPGEQWLFRREIDQFIHCSTFFDHIAELLHINGSQKLLLIEEWGSFFSVNIESLTVISGGYIAKRSVPLAPEELTVRRLENKTLHPVVRVTYDPRPPTVPVRRLVLYQKAA